MRPESALALASELWNEARVEVIYDICEKHLKKAEAGGYAQGIHDAQEVAPRYAQELPEAEIVEEATPAIAPFGGVY